MNTDRSSRARVILHIAVFALFTAVMAGCNCKCGPCEQVSSGIFGCNCDPYDQNACQPWQVRDANACNCQCGNHTLFGDLQCGDHGTGVPGCTCECDPGWCGIYCDVAILECPVGETWDSTSCICTNGCPEGFYGPDCSIQLPQNYLVATLVNTNIGDTFIFVSDLQGMDDALGMNGANGWSAQVAHTADPANTFDLFHYATDPFLDTTTYTYPQNLAGDVLVDRPGWPPPTASGQNFPLMESGSIRYDALPFMQPGVTFNVRFAYGITSNGIHIEVLDGRCYVTP